MIDFYDKHKSDRFEFIAFHDARARSFEELDEKLVKIKQEHWKGRDLPFPVLLDSTGETIKQYGVHAFPTQILIDPDGKLVGQGHLEGFKEKLLGEAKGEAKPASRKNEEESAKK